MSSRKLQKEIENTFKKINEGLESFNYHYDRHQDLNNQVLDRNLESQKEKLETDLKREIKKLQKNRESIKNWQSNDNVELVVTRNKLQEYRKLVEEAMEKYKEVEKSSKMKSFSNQSILLASIEESQHLTKEAIEVIGFLNESSEELSQQVENLEAEYERLSSKKTKKNSAYEHELQEIEGFINSDRFHLESFEQIITHIKQKQIDPELVVKIKEDISFFIESNQEPDFINDDTLYDEIFQQAESNYKYVPKDNGASLDVVAEAFNEETPINNTAPNDSNGTTKPKIQESKKEKTKSPTPNTPTKKLNDAVTTPVKNRDSTLDIDIVQKLKPAATPSRVTGEVAWSSIAGVAAAVSGVPSSADSDKAALSDKKSDSEASLVSEVTDATTVNEGADILGSKVYFKQLSPDSPFYSYSKVFENSGLSDAEMKLFSDGDMVRLPPGIQSLIMSFTATRRVKSADSKDTDAKNTGKLLVNSPSISSLSAPILKPYLPKAVQNSFFYFNQRPNETIPYVKLPLRFNKYQNQWNEIRGGNAFDSFVSETKSILEQQPSNLEAINEMFMIFFFGFYYGLTPLENLIAETKLFELGWKPYSIKTPTQLLNGLNNDKYYYWIRNTKVDSEEFGDYQIFDLSSWDIHLKLGYKLDTSLTESTPTSLVS